MQFIIEGEKVKFSRADERNILPVPGGQYLWPRLLLLPVEPRNIHQGTRLLEISQAKQMSLGPFF